MNPRVGIVAGSGITLDSVLDRIERIIPFEGVPGLVPAAVHGHCGEFRFGHCGETPIVLQCGRLHLYEGHGIETVTRTVDAMGEWGVEVVLFTNAAGGLRDEMRPGALVAVDTVRLWPCRAWPGAPESIPTDVIPDGCDFQGTLQWMHGPCYETRAEIRALQSLGAAVVGMSTAPELARCRALGIRTAAVSCVTNSCCQPHTLTHEEVLTTAARASHRLTRVIREAIASGLPAEG